MWSRSDSFERSEMFTRLTATVIMSAPEASCARTMTDGDEYLPVPTMSRDEKERPAITSVSDGVMSGLTFSTRAAAHEVDDFDLIARVDGGPIERRALEHDEVVFDGHASLVYVERGEQLADGQRSGELVRIAIERDGQRHELHSSSPAVT